MTTEHDKVIAEIDVRLNGGYVVRHSDDWKRDCAALLTVCKAQQAELEASREVVNELRGMFRFENEPPDNRTWEETTNRITKALAHYHEVTEGK